MRISAEAKEKTRQSILDAAQRLFSTAGFDQTSTRDLSSEAGIATGTLFNYFPTKESLALAIVADAIDKARGDFESRLRPDASLDEALFDHVAAGLRRLAPHRHWVTQVMDGSLGPLSAGPSPPTDAGDRIRLEHLATVRAVIAVRGPAPPPVGPAVLDALPGPARLLVAGRVARTGRHPRSAGRIDAPVCPVPRPRQ
jgi:AcrR family transcriptional regulator